MDEQCIVGASKALRYISQAEWIQPNGDLPGMYRDWILVADVVESDFIGSATSLGLLSASCWRPTWWATRNRQPMFDLPTLSCLDPQPIDNFVRHVPHLYPSLIIKGYQP
jgi:hypothetical protein